MLPRVITTLNFSLNCTQPRQQTSKKPTKLTSVNPALSSPELLHGLLDDEDITKPLLETEFVSLCSQDYSCQQQPFPAQLDLGPLASLGFISGL